MTKGQEKTIKKKSRGMTPEANWFAIWRVLFPYQNLPVSPCESFSISSFDSGSSVVDFENQIPLGSWDNALANDLERLSATIKERLHGVLFLTQLQQAILDQTVQQALEDYSRDLHSRIAQSHTPSSSNDLDEASTSLLNQDKSSPAHTIPHRSGEQAWSPSMMQSFLPRSMLVPGMAHSPIPVEADISLGLPPTMQPDPGFHGRQHLVDYGDLFFGLSLNPYLLPFDNREYHQWPAVAMPATTSA
jgi:hypothetical protein